MTTARPKLPRCLPVVSLLTIYALAALSMPASLAHAASAGGPVVACPSLANLRSILRTADGNAEAAATIARDPKSDLGCGVLDAGAVAAVADRLSLNGKAYECLSLRGTSICHWVPEGAWKPAAPPTPGGARR